MDIIKHDLKTFVSKHSQSESFRVCVRGKRKQKCYKTAKMQILDKLLSRDSGCSLVTQLDIRDPARQSWLSKNLRTIATLQNAAYSGVPLSSMTSSDRGLRIERIALSLDQQLHPGCAFSSSKSVDWVRAASGVQVGVEVKHGQMLFINETNCWVCRFSGIKCALSGAREQDSFDELWLVVYSPFRLHFFKHPGGTDCYVETGVSRAKEGQQIVFVAAGGMLDVKAALKAIMQKMETKGCRLFAEVFWDK